MINNEQQYVLNTLKYIAWLSLTGVVVFFLYLWIDRGSLDDFDESIAGLFFKGGDKVTYSLLAIAILSYWIRGWLKIRWSETSN